MPGEQLQIQKCSSVWVKNVPKSFEDEARKLYSPDRLAASVEYKMLSYRRETALQGAL